MPYNQTLTNQSNYRFYTGKNDKLFFGLYPCEYK